MSLAWFPPSETDHNFGKRELSAYEQFLEEQRQHRELEKQVRKYGDDAMRVDPQMNLTDAASSMPTESFTRAYQMRMPGSQVEKAKEKDPLASLIKAMQIDVTKTREKVKTDGRKSSASKESDDGKFHGTRARYPRSRADREPSEIESQYAS
jgi:hypothetical protein